MRTILIYRDDLLPPSETFVLAQASSLRRYHSVFAGLREVTPSLLTEDARIVASPSTLIPRSMQSRAETFFGVVPRFQNASFLEGIRSTNPAAIHAHFAPDAIHALPLAIALNVPLIVTLHGYDVTIRPNSHTLLHQLLQKRKLGELHRQATIFLCVSEFIRQKAVAAGYPPSKLLVHRIGIDVSKFQPSNLARSSQNVLFVGRLTEKKGCQYLIRAMQRVQRQIPSAQLIVAGDGPLRLSLEELARNLAVPVKFAGLLDQESVRRQLASARVFAFPSVTARNGDSEGLGMVMLEAQASGIPVVATRHGGVPEGILDGERGLLCEEFDVDALAAHIIKLLTDRQHWNDHHQRGPAFVREHFNLSRQTALLEEIYDSVIKPHGDHSKSFS